MCISLTAREREIARLAAFGLKNREIAEPRQICVYLITELMTLPLVSVGQAMGGRDHTTVIHARDKVAKLVAENGRFATEINDLKNMILKK